MRFVRDEGTGLRVSITGGTLMKQTISAMAALGLTLGLAATAQAHGAYRQSAAEPPQMQRTMATNQQMSHSQIMQLQRQLRAEGLYRGKIDGIMNRGTRLALNRSQHGMGLKQTAQLHRPVRAQHKQPQAHMVGSSNPPSATG